MVEYDDKISVLQKELLHFRSTKVEEENGGLSISTRLTV